MYCPQCGTNQSNDLKFCKSCGANLAAVRQVVGNRDTSEKFDWSKSWVTEMFLSPVEREKRKQELELERGITPEVKRLREVKAGVITASAGIAIGIFLYVFMQGIILGGKIAPDAAEIVSRLWVVGVIPLLIGIALLINGLFVQTSGAVATRRKVLGNDVQNHSLPSGDTSPPIPAGFSVTEQTTRQLQGPEQKQ